MDGNEFGQALERAKAHYRDWWNSSWLPDPNSPIEMIRGLALRFGWDEASDGFFPFDQGGAIPCYDTWMEISDAVQKFYECHTDHKIDEYNWWQLARDEEPKKRPPRARKPQVPTDGYVYVLKGGPYYKIGRSTDASRRITQIQPQMPFVANLICSIPTDNMYVLEATLHERYADKRVNGEWFTLDDEDVAYIKGLADE